MSDANVEKFANQETTEIADPEELPPIVGTVTKAVAFLCVVLLVGVLAVILLQVLMRYVFNNPLVWTDEVTRLQLVWVTFLGAVLGYRFGADIAVDALEEHAKGKGWNRTAGAIEFIVQSAIVAVSLVFIFGGLQLVEATMTSLTPALGLPVAIFYAAVPVCGALVLVSAGERVLLHVRSRRGEGS